ncbi:hypothetical protein RFI_25240 [Reticulomyxa filosa]|uniref:Uncharacterized protein n=1 Tax=Reticulomyxa filosa TaxID=46433 RepID=X6MFE0_RETFI|nr:hypothetical protein RFI_25240 [Reticulomyxa filosa]|eukprot:ETO12137.1 hypothetical protein RFI_25240 [Reticulomyxa filosa]
MGFSKPPIKMGSYNDNNIPYPQHANDNNIPCPQRANDKTYQRHYTVVHAAAQLGNLSQFKLVLQNNPHIDINDSYNEHRQTPLRLAVDNQHWDIARYCIEKGAYIDIREGVVNSLILSTPFENIMKFIMKHKKNKNSKEFLDATEMGKWILRQRIMYPIKRIEYAIDYGKNNENDITQIIDEEGYETLLEESAAFLLGVNQTELKEILIKNNLLYWAASRNIIRIKDEGWYSMTFLIFRIFLLFEICVNLRKEERHFIGLPKGTTFEQVYEKLVRELQVQLTTYWDYVTTEEFKHKCPDLFEDWSCNVVDRLMNLKPWCEVTLVVGHDGHCIYLSLCKTLDSILVRVDNRWMKTVPANTPHPKNELGLIQPYLVAYFNVNSSNIDKNKKWLKEYIKNATKLRESDSEESMRHLYCSDNNKSSFPCEGNVLSIVKHWPYRPIETGSFCYLRSNNVGYRIRLGDVIYTWVKNQEYKSFVFNTTNYNTEKLQCMIELYTNNFNVCVHAKFKMQFLLFFLFKMLKTKKLKSAKCYLSWPSSGRFPFWGKAQHYVIMPLYLGISQTSWKIFCLHDGTAALQYFNNWNCNGSLTSYTRLENARCNGTEDCYVSRTNYLSDSYFTSVPCGTDNLYYMYMVLSTTGECLDVEFIFLFFLFFIRMYECNKSRTLMYEIMNQE